MLLRAWIAAIVFLLLISPLSSLRADAKASDEGFFLIGPYPSKGVFEYRVDAGQIRSAFPGAVDWMLVVERTGERLKSQVEPLPDSGLVQGYVDVGPMPDKTTYTLRALVRDGKKKELWRKEHTFTRQVMPFETAPPAGVADIIVPPFTPPTIDGHDLSCIGRTYHHGTEGLLRQITAADKELLARPAIFLARTGAGPLTPLVGDEPTLAMDGPNRATFTQTFTGSGIRLNVNGAFDYDGFYKFTVEMAPDSNPVQLHDLRMEVAYRDSIAQLIEAAVTWRRIEGTQKECMGELDPKQGWLWDSKTFPSKIGPRHGNMPPFIWIGDDDRGLVYSTASEQGMHNDPELPAAQLERQGDQVVYTAWFVNSTLELKQPRTFEFAFQASPFKPMPEKGRLWRNQDARMPYRDGILFTNWFTDGSYPTYGRFLSLDLLKRYAEKTGADQVGVMASAVSECGGTPEYLQFWHEWGSDMVWPIYPRSKPEDWAVEIMEEAGLPMNKFIRVESASNVSATNVEYRLWWFNQELLHAGISYIYQDNPPYVYYDDPIVGYGYTRDDGRREGTSAIWNSRQFAKRIATATVEAGKTDSPYLWLNAISPVIPGRSFARKMLNGEYLYTKLFTLGQIRVMASKQWGMVLDWYPFPQTEESGYPNIGPVRKYWREVFSRLLLHDITSFSGGDDAGYAEMWLNALDLFWLDDPTLVWHPYYRNATAPTARRETTHISTYTARDRALWFISNQGPDSVVEHVGIGDVEQFDAKGLQFFYNAETGERIDRDADGALKLFIPGYDYRVVIGFPTAWEFAAGQPVAERSSGLAGNLAPQSGVDPEVTLTAISRQLLTSPRLRPVPGAHRLYERWMQQVMSELAADAPEVKYYNAKAMSDIDFGKPGIQAAVFHNLSKDYLLVSYYNDSQEDVSLPESVRAQIATKVGKGGHNFIIHPVYGNSEWAFIDIPAKSGLLEIYYSNSADFWGPRRGPFQIGTLLGNIRAAVDDIQRKNDGRPLK